MGQKIRLTESIRLLFFNFILVFLVASQILQSQFINTSVLKPGFTVLSITFFLHYMFLLVEKYWEKYLAIPVGLFIVDSILITILGFYLSGQLVLFILLFLLNIALCGYLFATKGAFLMALFTSICFSFLVAVDESLQGQRLILAVGLNNIAFFAVAALSGTISQQLSSLGFELKKTGKDLKVLRDINQLILKSMHSGFISCNEEGNIVLSNDSAQSILDNSIPERTNIINIFPGIREQVSHTQSVEGSTKIFEYKLKQKESELDLLFSVSDISSEDNRLLGRIYLFTDITKIKRLEKINQRNEKLAAVGQLAAGIAHEIRNPLASMSGSLQFLQANLKVESADEKKLMEIVLREIERLDNLITDFLEFVHPEEMPKEEVDLAFVINSCLEQVQYNQKLQKNVSHNIHFDYQPIIMGNEAKLKQVFLNLIINSYHAMEKTDKGELKIYIQQIDGKPVVRISDNGCGMSDETKKRLFEPFHTTKAKGTGLGLATTHKILQAHQAEVDVESAIDSGTTFQIEFPASSLVQVKSK